MNIHQDEEDPQENRPTKADAIDCALRQLERRITDLDDLIHEVKGEDVSPSPLRQKEDGVAVAPKVTLAGMLYSTPSRIDGQAERILEAIVELRATLI